MTLLGALGSRLEERLKNRSATVGVVGLEYVGLPLAVATQVAEMVKLFENTFRSVNIALVNELAIMSPPGLGLRVWEVIGAAATKLFGFMPLLAGARGGRPLPAERPALSLLADAARRLRGQVHRLRRRDQRRHAPLRGAARHRGAQRPAKAVRGSRILALGVAYKAGVGDIR